MVYIWAVEALGKGPSEPKTTEVSALHMYLMTVVKSVKYLFKSKDVC